MTNVLINGGFESEWEGSHRCYVLGEDGNYYADIGNIFTPAGWTAWFRHTSIYAQPEARDTRATNPDRFRSGKTGFLIFTFGRCHDAGLFQRVSVTPESTIEFSAYAHAWSNHNDDSMPDTFPHGDDPKWSEGAGFRSIGWRTDTLETTGDPQDDAKLNFAFAVGIDPFGGVNPLAKSVVWSDNWSIYNGFVHKLSVEAVAVSSTVTVFLHSNTLYPFKHNDAYWDDASLVECPPEGQCRGHPREEYARTYHVLPRDATWPQASAVFKAEGFQNARTVGYSFDDAGLGDLDDRTAVLWGIPDFARTEYSNWYDKWYPGVKVEFCDLPGEEPPTPTPSPPPMPGELLSLHLQTEVEGWLGYVRDVKPRWVKLVGNMELGKLIKSASPDTKVLFRHHISHNSPFLNAPNKTQAACEFLALFWDSLVANAEYIDAIEGLNETIATHDTDGIYKAVDFEVALSDELARRDIGVGACLLNTAVGNPDHGRETVVLVSAAEAAVRNNGYIGYHPYFPCTPVHATAWMESEWKHHHGRALASWDETFAFFGVKPRYLFTEGGAVGAEVRLDGRPGALNANAGWRYSGCLNGNLDAYITLLLRFRAKVAGWNATHDNRAETLAIFTTGAAFIGWQEFAFNTNELQALEAALG